MPVDLSLIDEAEHRAYVKFNQDRNRITYLCGREHSEDYSDPEELVRAYIYSWLIIEKGYPSNRILVEFEVPRREPSDRADIVVFSDDRRTDPFLVVEAKQENCTNAEWRRAIEQGFGNSNSLRTTRYLLVDKGRDSILYDIHNHPPTERQINRLGDRTALSPNYGIARQFRLIAGTDLDIQPIDPKTLEALVRRAHAKIWAGGKRDPLTAFDEWSKILFAKIWDERHTPTGEPRCLQIGSGDTESLAASRIMKRYKEARRSDPSIFADEWINLPDNKLIEVVNIIQDVGFTLCDIDALGSAFEHFFSSVFRGDLGQYFTRRELVRFICGVLHPKDTDFVLDPTAGSGGFLLETLIQVWHYIDDNYAGQTDAERKKIDFSHNQLFGIEINAPLSRVCKTNLLIHKDGHTNIEGERSCLDSTFNNPRITPNGSIFTLVIGNPPFGDEVEEGDRDRLGDGSLSDFEISREYTQISSELIIVERGLQFLIPGHRLGMVVPDGALNNSGEGSRCPEFRRFILKNARIEMIVSLPDFAFRKAGAQNKTSLLFLRKFTTAEKRSFDSSYSEFVNQLSDESITDVEKEKRAIHHALRQNSYSIFLAEVDHIGYLPTGGLTRCNQLYELNEGGRLNYDQRSTVLGQYSLYSRDPNNYAPSRNPSCQSICVVDALDAHESYRLDPKFHLFQLERIRNPPPHMTEERLGDLLTRREEYVEPTDFPDQEFLTLTLSQEGVLSPREAGKGNNPPSWYGAYFTRGGSRWFRAHAGDVLISQIDLWKGCIAVIPPEYDQAIVTQEFPIYEVDESRLDPRYLTLLLRSEYFQRAFRAITTGHSNRRRTQKSDFENLVIFRPDINLQRIIADLVDEKEQRIIDAEGEFENLLAKVEEVVLGRMDPMTVLNQIEEDSH